MSRCCLSDVNPQNNPTTSPATAERKFTKLGSKRKQVLKVFYQVWVFQADRKSRMAALVSDCLGHFQLLLCNRNFTKLGEKQVLNNLYQVCLLSGRSENKDCHPGFWLSETFHFRFLLCNLWTEFDKNWQEASTRQRPLPSLCFSGR